MKYYVVADIHGFYTPLRQALLEAGFFDDPAPHKLVICGDLFDRGAEAKQLQAFILQLMAQDAVILIRGNHEDLTLQLLNTWHMESYFAWHHVTNGTVDTVWQLTDCKPGDLDHSADRVGRRLLHSPYIQKIIPAMVDYYETAHYVFVHGWFPCIKGDDSAHSDDYRYIADWRSADGTAWDKARWYNGMRAAAAGVVEPGKTTVCGHWHCSFGHTQYEKQGPEFGPGADFSPYYGPGIIALDACTVRSGRVNYIVLED